MNIEGEGAWDDRGVETAAAAGKNSRERVLLTQ
jgi:hypothetical protein